MRQFRRKLDKSFQPQYFLLSYPTCSFSIEHTFPYYIQSCRLYMNTITWKCYRCDLTFKEKSIATIHKELLKHPVQQMKFISEL